MNISIAVDSKTIAEAYRKAPAKTVKKLADWIQTTGALVEREEKQQVPVRTGVLQNSVHNISNGTRLLAEVKPTIEYAPFVNNGTRFQKANPFAERTYKAVKPIAERNADKAIEELVRSI